MIILHNQHDKDSREFVEKYKDGNEVLNYPECLQQFSDISGFPSVVVTLPKKIILSYTVPGYTDSETGVTYESEIVEEQIIEEHIDIVRCPVTWDDVEKYIQDYINYDPGAEYR